ncbi:MAG: hypothetical protein EOL95_09195 [Bacteroidia bacterium]|nr:hypothetical protein [Bacteroidia bacterium]
MSVINSYEIKHISGAGTTQVISTSGNLHTINISVAFTTVNIYDATSGTTLPIFSNGTGVGCFIIDGRFKNGLRIITVGDSGKLSVTYNS